MKKLILFIMIMILTLLPVTGFATNSPTMKSLYVFDVNINFDFLDQSKTNLDLTYWEPFKILNELNEDNDWNNYHIDEALILYLKEKYEAVEITFPTPYEEGTTVFGVFISEDEEFFISYGVITEFGNVIFDFGFLPPETVIMYVISNKEA